MRKGLLGAYQLGVLEGFGYALEITAQITGKSCPNIDPLFYATAFQSGVDHFILDIPKKYYHQKSQFVKSRITYLPKQKTNHHRDPIREMFSRHLPPNWERDEAYSSVWGLSAFLGDLLSSMEAGCALLATLGLPDPSRARPLLPAAALLPIEQLLDSFEVVTCPGLALRGSFDRDHLERFQQVLLSDLFTGYMTAQSALEDELRSVRPSLEGAAIAGGKVVERHPALVALRRGSIAVLSFTPKLIDAVFGKLPGTLAEAGAKLGASYMEERKRVVVYDFRAFLERTALDGFVEMLSPADHSRFQFEGE